MTCKIYCLYSSLDFEIFYVGSTAGKTSDRVRAHISAKSENLQHAVCMKKRSIKINEIINNGGKILSTCIIIVPIKLRDVAEKQAYEYYSQLGYNLLQNPNQFNSLKKSNYGKRSKEFSVKD